MLITSPPHQPSRLQDGPLLSEEVHAREVAMEEQRTAKQICDEDRRRFKKLYDEERESEKIRRLYNSLPPKTTQKSEEVRAHELEEQKRAKQLCDEDRKRFKQLYDAERESGRIGRLRSGERSQDGAYKVAQGKQQAGDHRPLARRREREEQQAKDAQIVQNRKLARQRAWQEQRDKDEQLLESYRLAKLRDKEQRKLRVRQDEQRRRITRARDDSMIGALLQHEASIRTYDVESLVGFNARSAYRMTIDAK